MTRADTEALRALAAKWRKEADNVRHDPEAFNDKWLKGYMDTAEECADELDALIATLPAEAGSVIHPETVAWNPARLREDTAYRISPLAEDGGAGAVEVFAYIEPETFNCVSAKTRAQFPEDARTFEIPVVRLSTLTRQQAENERLASAHDEKLVEYDDIFNMAAELKAENEGLRLKAAQATGALARESEWQRKCESAESERERWKSEYATLADRSVEEQARVGELGADARRLDRMIRNCAVVETDGSGNWRVRFDWMPEGDNFGPYADSPRAAIDAALEGGRADEEIPCSIHPDAPHGFNRNGSHNAGRYVCDCEGWLPPVDEERAEGGRDG